MSAAASQVPALCPPSSPSPSPVADGVEAGAEAGIGAWRRVRSALQADDAEAFRNWLHQLDLASLREGIVTLSAPTAFLRKWVDAHYLPRLLARWQEVEPDVDAVRITLRSLARFSSCPARAAPPVAETPAAPAPSAAAAPSERTMLEAARLASPLQAHCRFETFVEGASNALALAAAKSVIGAEPARRRSMNPLYIHAPVGLGKTHLLQAIVANVNDSAPEHAVYLTAEKFCGTVAHAMRRVGSFAAPADLLRNDVVAIDDIQFIAGAALRREFARLVERLMEDGRQVVVASDRPADQHDLFDDRLRSRLGGGLAIAIGRMDAALRRAVIDQRIKVVAADWPSFAVPEDVVAMVVDQVTRDGRDLEGAVNRLALLARANRTIDRAAAELAIADLLRAERATAAVRIETIQQIVAHHFNVARGDMLSGRRTRNVVHPRQVAMHLAKEMTLRSLPEIGRRFGGRDHTTVLHAVRKISALRETDQALAAELELLAQQIRAAA